MTTAHPKLLFVQLNEVNFDIADRYVQKQHALPSFARLLRDFRKMETFAERDYEHLEPWIQWVSAQTGKTYDEHRVFRLGDIVKTELPQVFEALESRGMRVGAVSPMNASNRMKAPAYFVPDPWTVTPSDNSGFSRRLTEMLRQTVNDNASQRVSLRSKLVILEALLRSLDPVRTWRVLSLIASTRRKPWLKSLVLDELLHLVHLSMLRRGRPDVSFVFFNAGAHIQHHYFFNSEHADTAMRNPSWYVPKGVDPVLEMLKMYDRILADYLSEVDRGVRLVVATGLTQVPYDRVKFYYRLADHRGFLAAAGIRFRDVLPRMTRDFEILFDDEASAHAAADLLREMRLERDGALVFREIEERGHGLFVSLTYPDEIHPDDALLFTGGRIDGFGRQVAFVAIKNGMHSSKGFAFVSPGTPAALPSQPVHVSALYDLTIQAAS